VVVRARSRALGSATTSAACALTRFSYSGLSCLKIRHGPFLRGVEVAWVVEGNVWMPMSSCLIVSDGFHPARRGNEGAKESERDRRRRRRDSARARGETYSRRPAKRRIMACSAHAHPCPRRAATGRPCPRGRCSDGIAACPCWRPSQTCTRAASAGSPRLLACVSGAETGVRLGKVKDLRDAGRSCAPRAATRVGIDSLLTCSLVCPRASASCLVRRPS
jgi:hypothetical protein